VNFVEPNPKEWVLKQIEGSILSYVKSEKVSGLGEDLALLNDMEASSKYLPSI